MIENRKVMGQNIQKQMDLHGLKATDVCRALGFKHNTFSGWINGKSYPRIDAIEKMANYFGVSKSVLVESDAVIYVDIEQEDEIASDKFQRMLMLYKKYNEAPLSIQEAVDKLLEIGG